MRKTAVTILMLTLTCHTYAAQLFSAGWLERCCIAIAVFDKDPKSFTKDQEKLLNEYTCFITGYLSGINGLRFSDRNKSPLCTFDDQLYDPRISARFIYSFIQKNRDRIPESTLARNVVTAWFFSMHPQSNATEKAASEFLLENMAVNKKATDSLPDGTTTSERSSP